MNMFAPSDQKDIESYKKAIPADRKETFEFLDDFIKKTAPNLKPYFATNMLGYGPFPYKNYKKEDIEWPTISLANKKQYISIYVCSVTDGQYVAEKYADELGKVKVGKSCISFKKLEDLDLKTLKKVIKLAEKNPGFG